MEKEIHAFVLANRDLQTPEGMLAIMPFMAQITLFTAALTLQGKEVRDKLDTTYADLYHALDDGMAPINFLMPGLPLPINWRRDAAQRKVTKFYTDIIHSRRRREKDSEDMLWTLMEAKYKDGSTLTDAQVASLMIALLMGGQHSTSATGSWIMLYLADEPKVQEDLYQEQLRELGEASQSLNYDGLQRLKLLTYVIRETLRLHSPIHSIMRKAKRPLPVEGTDLVVPASHVLLAAPAAMGRMERHFPNAEKWDPYRWQDIADPKDQEKEKVDYGYGLVTTGVESTYLPFGAGRHRCIGENYANMQIAMVISMLIRQFRFENPEGRIGVPRTDFSVSSKTDRRLNLGSQTDA